MKPKIYLAGPEVFLPNAVEHAEIQKQLCKKYNFIALHPMDNTIDLGNKDYKTAIQIYGGNIKQIRECDIIVANCNPFRSVCVMDDGTAYELGFGNALNKPTYGYISNLEPLEDRTIREYTNKIDKDGYVVINDFTTSINLMMQCGMTNNGGRLIEGDFEECLKALREDIDSGKLKL